MRTIVKVGGKGMECMVNMPPQELQRIKDFNPETLIEVLGMSYKFLAKAKNLKIVGYNNLNSEGWRG